jgi:23S rRNA (cytidine1920-2'-O)/16S rRNA (cytidine1409-2'-O)-methyltransferase
MAESRAKAQRLVMAGQVRVNGQVFLKPATSVNVDAQIQVESGPRFVSRGGDKLEAALSAFPIQVEGQVCVDVGASTGGFCDCLLQHQAARVYAIDVGKGILHWKLRQDARVVVMEETNARYIESLPEPVNLVTIDASFISLKVLLPVIRNWLDPHVLSALSQDQGEAANIIALIKPQFEAGRAEANRGEGVIRDPAVHRAIVEDILTTAVSLGYAVKGLLRSPLLGPKGNVEFLAWLVIPPTHQLPLNEIIAEVFE